METKKFKIKRDGDSPKGGRNNTQTILTASGVIAAGSAGLGYAVGSTQHEQAQTEAAAATAAAAAETAEQTQSQETAQQEQQNAQPTNQETASNASGEAITEPQPTDSSQHQTAQNQTSGQGQEVVEGDVNPDEIAQQIAQANEIDNNDIDTDDMLTVVGLRTAYGPDGSEMLVAVVHTPDGGEYLLADTDGDGVFSDVFDLEGNFVAEAEGNLTASDLEEMADPSGGYLASVGNEVVGDDPTGDIIDTLNDHPDDLVDIAENDPLEDDEEISDEELLAQLLDDDDDMDSIGDQVIDDDEYDDDDDADLLADDDTEVMDDIDSDEA